MFRIDIHTILRRTLLLWRKRNYRLFPILAFCILSSNVFVAQPPAGYYSSAENLSGESLRAALHSIVRNHSSVSYSQLWDSFYSTDMRPDNGKVWDIYSDRPGQTAAYYYTFGNDQCGSYSSEGSCYNREHSVPKSWFGDAAPMYTDLFHLYPTDGFVNGKRGNLPFGEVANATWTSTNGSKLGANTYPGYYGQVFEPIDSFKGDLARTYFYMTLCYRDKNLGVEEQSMFSGGDLKPWSKDMLLKWNAIDPVSQKEIDRNNAVFLIQHNRNPFIDFPELVEKVFGNDTDSLFITNVGWHTTHYTYNVYPNPVQNEVFIDAFDTYNNESQYVALYDIAGKCLLGEQILQYGINRVDVSHLKKGVYFLKIIGNQCNKTYKIIKQ